MTSRKETCDEGQYYSEKWYDDNNELHREDGPAYSEIKHNGEIIEEHWYLHGKEHRIGGPSSTIFANDGINFIRQSWSQNDEWHRLDGPAHIEYFEDGDSGVMSSMSWYKHGGLHREDGPAYTTYAHDGKLYSENWLFNGGYHRLDGPANIIYTNMYEEPEVREWWINNIRLTEAEIRKIANIEGDIPDKLDKAQSGALRMKYC